MKNVPPVVWQVAAIAAVGLVGLYLARKVLTGAAGAVKDAYSPGGVAYETGNTVQDAIVPGVDSLGTWLYGLFNPREASGEAFNTRNSQQQAASVLYPGGVNYPARIGAPVGSNSWIPDYLRDLYASPGTAGSIGAFGDYNPRY